MHPGTKAQDYALRDGHLQKVSAEQNYSTYDVPNTTAIKFNPISDRSALGTMGQGRRCCGAGPAGSAGSWPGPRATAGPADCKWPRYLGNRTRDDCTRARRASGQECPERRDRLIQVRRLRVRFPAAVHRPEQRKWSENEERHNGAAGLEHSVGRLPGWWRLASTPRWTSRVGPVAGRPTHPCHLASRAASSREADLSSIIGKVIAGLRVGTRIFLAL